MRLEGPTIVGLGGIPTAVLFTAAVLVFSAAAALVFSAAAALVFSAAALVFSAAALVFSADAEFTPTGCSVDGGDSDDEGWLVDNCSVDGGDSEVEGWPIDGMICPKAILVQYPIAAMPKAIIVDFKIISIIVWIPQIM
jgi:hypothetical protein